MATIADIFALTVRLFFQLDMIFVGMAAAILLHFALQFRIARLRRRQIRELEEDMEDLRAADGAMRKALAVWWRQRSPRVLRPRWSRKQACGSSDPPR